MKKDFTPLNDRPGVLFNEKLGLYWYESLKGSNPIPHLFTNQEIEEIQKKINNPLPWYFSAWYLLQKQHPVTRSVVFFIMSVQ